MEIKISFIVGKAISSEISQLIIISIMVIYNIINTKTTVTDMEIIIIMGFIIIIFKKAKNTKSKIKNNNTSINSKFTFSIIQKINIIQSNYIKQQKVSDILQ